MITIYYLISHLIREKKKGLYRRNPEAKSGKKFHNNMYLFSHSDEGNYPINPLMLRIKRAKMPTRPSLFVFNRSSALRISYVKNKAIILAATKPICHLFIPSSGRFGTIIAIKRIKISSGVVLNPRLRVNFSVNRTEKIIIPKDKL